VRWTERLGWSSEEQSTVHAVFIGQRDRPAFSTSSKTMKRSQKRKSSRVVVRLLGDPKLILRLFEKLLFGIACLQLNGHPDGKWPAGTEEVEAWKTRLRKSRSARQVHDIEGVINQGHHPFDRRTARIRQRRSRGCRP
jgi:hypothetical protein